MKVYKVGDVTVQLDDEDAKRLGVEGHEVDEKAVKPANKQARPANKARSGESK